MLKYAKIINEETKQCEVGVGTNIDFYKSIGMVEMEVEQAYNEQWYLAGFCPTPPQPSHEEQREKREEAYQREVDPITCHIQRLNDEEQTPELIEEIEQLKQERFLKVQAIKKLYPYGD